MKAFDAILAGLIFPMLCGFILVVMRSLAAKKKPTLDIAHDIALDLIFSCHRSRWRHLHKRRAPSTLSKQRGSHRVSHCRLHSVGWHPDAAKKSGWSHHPEHRVPQHLARHPNRRRSRRRILSKCVRGIYVSTFSSRHSARGWNLSLGFCNFWLPFAVHPRPECRCSRLGRLRGGDLPARRARVGRSSRRLCKNSFKGHYDWV